MRIQHTLLASALIALGSTVLGQNPQDRPPTAQPPVRPADPQRVQPPQPPMTTPPAIAQPPQVMNAPSTDSSVPPPVLSSAPRMIGDFPGYYGNSRVAVNSTLSALVPVTIIGPNGEPQVVFQMRQVGTVTDYFDFRTLALSRGAFKIAENESVAPQDRFYVTYNYFSDVPSFPAGGASFLTPAGSTAQLPLRNTFTNTVNGQGAPTSLTTASVGATDIHRETVGLEKTFLDGRVSFGARLPVFQTAQGATTATTNAAALGAFTATPNALGINGINPGFDGGRVGDVSFVGKYAILNDFEAGRTVSTGMVVTAPTGGGIPMSDGSRMYSTLLQPYVGFLQSFDRFFTHGFTAIAVPTDARDITIWFNDIGVGYVAYRAEDDGFLRSIVPTFETHISTPLANGTGGVSALDVVVLTGGVSFGMGQHTVLTLGAASPVTGPRPFGVEAMAQLNWLY